MEGKEEEPESRKEDDDNDVDMIEEGKTSGSGLRSRVRDLGSFGSAPSSSSLYSDVAENHFRASTQEIGEWLLGQAMTLMDFFTSLEDQQDSIENIVSMRNRFHAGNACLIIDLEAAARKEAEEQGIDIDEMDRIDWEMDRQAFLNTASLHFPRRGKQELED